jgi:HEPN domain-containing protein
MGIKKKTGIALAIIVLVGGLMLMGCGNSAATSEMGKILQSFEKKITELSESLKKNDTNRIVEIEKEITDLKDSWATKRYEYGDELTPQEMDRMVKEFNRIIARFNEIEKKNIG